MSKRGKILGGIAIVLLLISIALFLFGKSGKSITYGIIGLAITVVYVMILRVVASYNKAKLRRREMEDLHKIANKISENN